jgi:hypothetical protein
MHLDRYKCTANETLLEYEFFSDGPNGKIRKLIVFTPHNIGGVTYFNLGFGDYIENTGKVNDLAVSDNKDTEKVLATVAATVMEFIISFPDMIVYARGSTRARTRLYQMGIAANWNEIQSLLDVLGFINGQWYPFEKNVNYEAFIVFKKNVTL